MSSQKVSTLSAIRMRAPFIRVDRDDDTLIVDEGAIAAAEVDDLVLVAVVAADDMRAGGRPGGWN
jgi:hypothetical protein